MHPTRVIPHPIAFMAEIGFRKMNQETNTATATYKIIFSGACRAQQGENTIVQNLFLTLRFPATLNVTAVVEWMT
jgi:hypothetical protein